VASAKNWSTFRSLMALPANSPLVIVNVPCVLFQISVAVGE
jgi:hypothetical protein